MIYNLDIKKYILDLVNPFRLCWNLWGYVFHKNACLKNCNVRVGFLISWCIPDIHMIDECIIMSKIFRYVNLVIYLDIEPFFKINFLLPKVLEKNIINTIDFVNKGTLVQSRVLNKYIFFALSRVQCNINVCSHLLCIRLKGMLTGNSKLPPGIIIIINI